MVRSTNNSGVIDRVKRGKVPAILSTDTGVATDVWGFVQKLPDNLWWSFYDPQKVDVDDLGRLSEKALRKFYQPGLSLMRLTALTNPRFRKDGIDNLRALDFDSFSYMEPVLHRADRIVLDHLEPLFAEQGGNSIYNYATNAAVSIEALAERIEAKGMTHANQVGYNDILSNLHASQEHARTKIKALSYAVDQALQEVDKIKVSSADKSLKRERVKALREHLLRVKKQGVDLYRNMETASADLKKLADSNRYTAQDFSAKLKGISARLDSRVMQTKSMSESLADMAYTRQNRKVRIRQSGRIVGEKNASAEHYRQLKLGMDMRFVPGAARTLDIVEPAAINANTENDFIITVDYGLNNAFKPDGSYIPLGERGERYGQDMGQHVAKMYALGRPEDALYAIQLLKMAEGRKSHQLFPDSFQDVVKRHMASFYSTNSKDIESDPHAAAFLERVRDISGDRDHSPLVWGPRDTAEEYYKKVRELIYGRMYPASDGFIATPLHKKIIQDPLVKMRGSIWAHMTGGRIIPVSDLKRPPKKGNLLEDGVGLAIKRNWFLWSKKQEKSEENPKPLGFMTRAPVWFSMPLRTGMMASVPAAVILGTGGVAAPMIVVAPVVAAGGVAAANYSFKAAKNAWALPFVNKPIKKAAKWTVIIGVTAGGVVLMAPVAPAVGAWGLGMAVASPMVAGGIASPFVGLAALKSYTMLKNLGKRPSKPVSFESYRQSVQIPDDPLDLHNEDGEFLALAPVPEPVVIELQEQPDAQQETKELVEEFLRRMESRDEKFMAGIQDALAASADTEDDDDILGGGMDTPDDPHLGVD